MPQQLPDVTCLVSMAVSVWYHFCGLKWPEVCCIYRQDNEPRTNKMSETPFNQHISHYFCALLLGTFMILQPVDIRAVAAG